MLRSFLICNFLLLFVQLSQQQAPIIETSLGKISGNVLTSRKSRDIYAYRGIHYAKPPTGLRRFAAPEPVEAWNETLNASNDGHSCPQSFTMETIDEDCLNLNVYTVNVTASNPVIVYIHGGANIYGSAHSEYGAGPQNLLDEDVVLVSISFRLGAFGFLSMKTYEASGNYGYLDQVLALKWVQQHIKNFGGDVSRVTIIGESAGSMAVTLHLTSPMSKGLFHGAIAMSGSATNHYDIDNVYWSRKLAYDLGCPRYNTQYLLNCLRQISWQRIVNITDSWEPYGTPNIKWNYEIDGKFLLERPSEAILNNRFNRVPIMAGITKNEFDFAPQVMQNKTYLLDDINENFSFYAPDFLQFNGTNNSARKADELREFYYNKTEINKYNLLGLGQMTSDGLIGHGVHRLVELARKFTDVYYYRFDYVGEKSQFTDNSGNPQGICHSDDLMYIFPTKNFEVEKNSTDMFMVDRMINVVASFAADRKPPIVETITWAPSTSKVIVVFYNNKYPFMSNPFYVERYAIWDELFPLQENCSTMRLPTLFLLLFIVCWNLL
ncbi:juvenile hormone esterase [Zeugodacus cucurbitae]|uniref:juvenile hormone esterase n=1 Tax=Zeugodacus cucurbitae TaxID=28588 RepID=UPI000596944E|nr:juvenile hormone esterase [Zeugodacus cucurbitae]XP_054082393.1 juvenile hormone esterase [Zeugodacus cucurbitae]